MGVIGQLSNTVKKDTKGAPGSVTKGAPGKMALCIVGHSLALTSGRAGSNSRKDLS